MSWLKFQGGKMESFSLIEHFDWGISWSDFGCYCGSCRSWEISLKCHSKCISTARLLGESSVRTRSSSAFGCSGRSSCEPSLNVISQGARQENLNYARQRRLPGFAAGGRKWPDDRPLSARERAIRGASREDQLSAGQTSRLGFGPNRPSQ